MALTELSRKPIPGSTRELVVYQTANPAPGAEVSEAVPARKHWKLRAVTGSLVTSVAVANRVGRLVIDDGANIVEQVSTGIAQVASLNNRYSTTPGQQGDGGGSQFHWPLPDALELPAGFRVRTSTVNIDVADDWGPLNITVEEITF